MTGEPTAAKMAKKLTTAFELVSNSSFIVNDNDEMSKANICLLREYLAGAESGLSDVIAALVGHTLAEVE